VFCRSRSVLCCGAGGVLSPANYNPVSGCNPRPRGEFRREIAPRKRPPRQTMVMSFSTAVTPGATHAVAAAIYRSCAEWTVPVSRTVPPSALTLIIFGSKNHERRRACMMSSLISRRVHLGFDRDLIGHTNNPKQPLHVQFGGRFLVMPVDLAS